MMGMAARLSAEQWGFVTAVVAAAVRSRAAETVDEAGYWVRSATQMAIAVEERAGEFHAEVGAQIAAEREAKREADEFAIQQAMRQRMGQPLEDVGPAPGGGE